MATITLRASGPASAQEVWERYARPALWPTWSPQIVGVECAAERLAAGVTGRVHGPLGTSVDFRVERWDESAATWSWTARRGPLRLHLEHGVRASGSGSRTWLTIRAPFVVVACYAPLAKLAITRLVRLS